MTTQNTNIIDSEIKDSQVVVAKSITDSFNRVQESSASDEIKSKLAELTKVVDVVRKHLPAEVAQDMAKDLDTFVVEATKKVPRRKWYDLSAEGLKQAAQTVGEIGKPILGLIKGV